MRRDQGMRGGAVAANGHYILRTRSYSLNWYLGVVAPPEIHDPRVKLRYSEIVSPGPAQVYAFIDEDDRTINDGTFFSPEEWAMWGDLPAVRHALGSNLSFADGHADHWRWRWPNKESGEPLLRIKAHPDPVFAAGFSPEGNILATASDDLTVKLWDLTTGAPPPEPAFSSSFRARTRG